MKQTLGVVAAVSFGDIAPGRAGDEPDADAAACITKLSDVASGQIAEAAASVPWLVRLSDEERTRLQASCPGIEERRALQSLVEVLDAMDPAELERASQEASLESGVVMTRADIDGLRENLERMDLMDRLAAQLQELGRLLGAIRSAPRRRARSSYHPLQLTSPEQRSQAILLQPSA